MDKESQLIWEAYVSESDDPQYAGYDQDEFWDDEESSDDYDYIDRHFNVITDDDQGNPTIEVDDSWYRVLLNDKGFVINVEPREDDRSASAQVATKILRNIQHRVLD